MPRDKHRPTWEEDGNQALGWLLVARYHPPEGVVTISWTKDGDLFRQTKQGAIAFPRDAFPDQSAALVDTLRMLTNPSLL